jgi:hypothetical protein
MLSCAELDDTVRVGDAVLTLKDPTNQHTKTKDFYVSRA